MLGSTGEGEREAGASAGVGELSPATLPKLGCAAAGRDRGVALSVNIRILRDQFTRCVSLTFTVTVITSWGFPTLLHCTGCTFNYSKHSDSTGWWIICGFSRLTRHIILLQEYILSVTPCVYWQFTLSTVWSQHTCLMYNHVCVCVIKVTKTQTKLALSNEPYFIHSVFSI